MNYGQMIRKLRKEKGLKQHELADILGVTVQTIGRWENCVRIPRLYYFKKMEDFFGCNIQLTENCCSKNGGLDSDESPIEYEERDPYDEIISGLQMIISAVQKLKGATDDSET